MKNKKFENWRKINPLFSKIKVKKGFSEFFIAQREIENFGKSKIKFVFLRT